MFFWRGSVGEPHNHTADSTRLIPSIISVRANGDVIYWLDIEVGALVQDTDLESIGCFVLDCEGRELKN